MLSSKSAKITITVLLFLLAMVLMVYQRIGPQKSVNQTFFGDNFQPENSMPDSYVQLNDTKVYVEIVQTREDRARGLSGRESLAENEGMFFELGYEDTYPAVWMKDMKFPIDVIWINGNTVVDITKGLMVPPTQGKDSQIPVYRPSSPVDSLLEVNSGFVDKHNVQIGDKVEISISE